VRLRCTALTITCHSPDGLHEVRPKFDLSRFTRIDRYASGWRISVDPTGPLFSPPRLQVSASPSVIVQARDHREAWPPEKAMA
jgi:hypothetical protein